jgi:hypothetical protein
MYRREEPRLPHQPAVRRAWLHEVVELPASPGAEAALFPRAVAASVAGAEVEAAVAVVVEGALTLL